MDHGPSVTLGSGVGLRAIYVAAKAQNKMFIGGTAATVSPASGYIQGAGHSAFSPLYGLAADNVLRRYSGSTWHWIRLRSRYQNSGSFWLTARS